jgi:hypothetical protein
LQELSSKALRMQGKFTAESGANSENSQSSTSRTSASICNC